MTEQQTQETMSKPRALAAAGTGMAAAFTAGFYLGKLYGIYETLQSPLDEYHQSRDRLEAIRPSRFGSNSVKSYTWSGYGSDHGVDDDDVAGPGQGSGRGNGSA